MSDRTSPRLLQPAHLISSDFLAVSPELLLDSPWTLKLFGPWDIEKRLFCQIYFRVR